MKLLIFMQLFCFVKLETIMINELDKSTTKIDISYSNLTNTLTKVFLQNQLTSNI